MELEKQKAEYSESLSVNRAEGLLMFAIGKLKSVALAERNSPRSGRIVFSWHQRIPCARGISFDKTLCRMGVASIRFADRTDIAS